MRIIVATITGLITVAAVAAQAAPHPNTKNLGPPGATQSFYLGELICGEGWRRALRQDWRGDRWWGPCVLNK